MIIFNNPEYFDFILQLIAAQSDNTKKLQVHKSNFQIGLKWHFFCRIQENCQKHSVRYLVHILVTLRQRYVPQPWIYKKYWQNIRWRIPTLADPHHAHAVSTLSKVSLCICICICICQKWDFLNQETFVVLAKVMNCSLPKERLRNLNFCCYWQRHRVHLWPRIVAIGFETDLPFGNRRGVVGKILNSNISPTFFQYFVNIDLTFYHYFTNIWPIFD